MPFVTHEENFFPIFVAGATHMGKNPTLFFSRAGISHSFTILFLRNYKLSDVKFKNSTTAVNEPGKDKINDYPCTFTDIF